MNAKQRRQASRADTEDTGVHRSVMLPLQVVTGFLDLPLVAVNEMRFSYDPEACGFAYPDFLNPPPLYSHERFRREHGGLYQFTGRIDLTQHYRQAFSQR
ncbi:hypothetical protein D3C71_78210 [compost metagenome]